METSIAGSLLIVGDPTDYSVQAFRDSLSSFEMVDAVSEADMSTYLAAQFYHVVIVDAGAVTDAAAVVSRIREQSPRARVVVITAAPHWKVAKAVYQAGAVEYTSKFEASSQMVRTLKALVEQAREIEGKPAPEEGESRHGDDSLGPR